MPCLYSCTLITRNLQNHNHQKEIKDKRYFPTEAKGNTEPPWIPFISCAGVSKCKSLTLHLNPCLYQGIDNRRKSTIALIYKVAYFKVKDNYSFIINKLKIQYMKLFSFSMDLCFSCAAL